MIDEMAKLPLPTVRCNVRSIELTFITLSLSSQCQVSQPPLFVNLCKVPVAIQHFSYLGLFPLQIVIQIPILPSKHGLRFLTNASVIFTQATADAAVLIQLARLLEVVGTHNLCESLL